LILSWIKRGIAERFPLPGNAVRFMPIAFCKLGLAVTAKSLGKLGSRPGEPLRRTRLVRRRTLHVAGPSASGTSGAGTAGADPVEAIASTLAKRANRPVGQAARQPTLLSS
jgi:hypothetical protein